MKKWGADPFERLHKAQDVALAKRQGLALEMRRKAQEAADAAAARAAKDQRFASLNMETALEYAAQIRLQRFDLDFEAAGTLNRPTLALLEHFLAGLTRRQSEAVLQWPGAQRDIAILHPLSMLAMLGSCPPQVSGGHRFCEAVPDVRTLLFPWRGGGTGSDQRRWLVDRNQITAPNALHQTRQRAARPDLSESLARLHETLGHLVRLKLRDATMPHLAHPTLAELYPAFAAEDTAPGAYFRKARHELFGRICHGAAIDRLTDHRGLLSDPAQAPFALFGVDARANFRAAFASPALAESAGGRPPDICLIDLNPPGLGRLGPGWEEIVARFIDALLIQFPTIPVLAVTHDGYVQRRLSALFRQSRAARTADRTLDCQPVIVRRTADIIEPDPSIAEVSAVSAVFQSTAGASVMALTALSEAARAMPDAVSAAAVRRSSANLRRASALPCGLDAAYEALSELEGQAAAEAFLEERSESSVLGPLQTILDSGLSGTSRAKLLAAQEAVTKAYGQLQHDTPIGSAVEELARKYAVKANFSIVVFPNATDLRLAERRLASDAEVSAGLKSRIERGLLKICHAGELEAVLSELEVADNRNSWKRIALIAPPIAFLDRLLVRPWLPEELLIVCDRAFTHRIAAVYGALARHPDLVGANRIGGRLAELAAKALKEAEARAVGPINLMLDERPRLDVRDTLVDMIDAERGGGEALVISLRSGRKLRTRPGSAMMRHDGDAPINPFDKALARDLKPGDVIVVPDRAFIDEARRLLPVELLARNWVKIYHQSIVAALTVVEGASLLAKARTVHAKLSQRAMRATSLAAVQEWLNAEAYLAAPAEQMRPHAPQSEGDFKALLEVLNIPLAMADKMWDEGIEQLRADKRLAGMRMAQAFISVLVDPHGVAAELSPDVRERIAALRARALDHLDIVVAVNKEEIA